MQWRHLIQSSKIQGNYSTSAEMCTESSRLSPGSAASSSSCDTDVTWLQQQPKFHSSYVPRPSSQAGQVEAVNMRRLNNRDVQTINYCNLAEHVQHLLEGTRRQPVTGNIDDVIRTCHHRYVAVLGKDAGIHRVIVALQLPVHHTHTHTHTHTSSSSSSSSPSAAAATTTTESQQKHTAHCQRNNYLSHARSICFLPARRYA